MALSGPSDDGHRYVAKAYDLGCRSFLVSRLDDGMPVDANYLVVPDVLLALQRWAAYHRDRFKGTVLGITGSSGKTTIKEWLYEILEPHKKIVKSPKSFNSQLGVALSALLMTSESDLAILEAGISNPGEMGNLRNIINPDIGIFSNIGEAHQANFESVVAKVREKLQLFTGVKELLYCRDHDLIHEESSQLFAGKTRTWGVHSQSELKVLERDGVMVLLKWKGQDWKLNLAAKDNYHYENVMHCVLFCLVQGLNIDCIQRAVPKLSAMNMRLEMKHGVDNILLVNDSYSADFQSLEVALDYLTSIAASQRKTLILSDFVEQSFNRTAYINQLNALIKAYKVCKLVGIGESLIGLGQEIVVDEIQLYEKAEDFLSKTTPSMFQDEAILVKGARRFRLERIVHFFQAKSHRTRLEVNLGALRHNYQWFKHQLPLGTDIMVMVKALSYGAGSFEVARLIENLGARYLAVAYIDEGVFLRKKGITCPIMVLNPEGEGFVNLVQYNLEPEVYSLSILYELLEFLRSENTDHPMAVHLNFDTGMHRLGFSNFEIGSLVEELNNSKGLVRVASVFTHLAASDAAEHMAFTQKQLEQIGSMGKDLKRMLGYEFIIHACNTAGILNNASSCFDMVRLGIGFYGVDPSGLNIALQSALRLVTQVSQVKEIEIGDSVGYGRRWVAKEKTKIATLPIGYADGLPRSAGNQKAKSYINGSEVPFIGSICMDMSMVDVTGLKVQEGDEVVIFENQEQLSTLSTDMGTIPYEVLAGISQRVKRIFIEE